jgi:hypothetical protein
MNRLKFILFAILPVTPSAGVNSLAVLPRQLKLKLMD